MQGSQFSLHYLGKNLHSLLARSLTFAWEIYRLRRLLRQMPKAKRALTLLFIDDIAVGERCEGQHGLKELDEGGGMFRLVGEVIVTQSREKAAQPGCNLVEKSPV
jgi:hypothetical protein